MNLANKEVRRITDRVAEKSKLNFNEPNSDNQVALPEYEPVYFEFEPSYSPDGKRMVYVQWNDEEMGKIQIVDKVGLTFNEERTLLTTPGIYRTPSLSPDGKWIVFVKEGGNEHQGFATFSQHAA